jgi:hypothetical protein
MTFAIDQLNLQIVDLEAAKALGFEFSAIEPKPWLSFQEKADLWSVLYGQLFWFDADPVTLGVTNKKLAANLTRSAKKWKGLAVVQLAIDLQSNDEAAARKNVDAAITRWQENEKAWIEAFQGRPAPTYR